MCPLVPQSVQQLKIMNVFEKYFEFPFVYVVRARSESLLFYFLKSFKQT